MLQNPQRYANSNLVSREGGLCMKGAIYENNGKGARWMVRFGKRILYKWWDAACRDLGIQGVPIYPGTRHSSVTALGQHFSPEEVMAGSGHKTSKAFMRYFSIAAESKKQVSLVARKGDQKVINIFTLAEKTNSLKS